MVNINLSQADRETENQISKRFFTKSKNNSLGCILLDEDKKLRCGFIFSRSFHLNDARRHILAKHSLKFENEREAARKKIFNK